ncbi:S-adenosyl-L-methionine-dependent methyltransferase [Aspergillus leporis]|uniref:S-adenosyl-L-methionine-dependent methyltransferase n=1 Tax=Aspergillus leporis TaxID=41062 RepID=A0A5N5WHP7_9EURO|nr:S-adenosyl-L-methionine-dependent methyltransferase [Aspergillus leporis]
MTLTSNQNAPEGRSWVVNHFAEREVRDHGSVWAALWDTQNNDMWDRGKPSPALIDLVEQREGLFQPLAADGRRKRALVPGCGRGYDVVMLALHGYDAYGVEISATGVAAAQSYASQELQKPQAYNFGERKSGWAGPGNATFIKGDFFRRDWEPKVLKDGEVLFDIIYDYTFLCALHPDLRWQWAARMAGLLRGDGYLVCLEFPLYKDPALLGPPWGLHGVHWDLLARGGDGVANSGTAPEITETDQLGGRFKRVLYVKPARSYEIGKGTDMLSVYALK